MTYKGQWHGDDRYLGFHYDLHAGVGDTTLGAHCSEEELIPMLEILAPEFVQTDCKGHAGYTSWFSKVPDASMPPHLEHDALIQWRAATKKLGLPLHCHYSGIYDAAAGAKHPEWCIVTADGAARATASGQNAGAGSSEVMCPRSDYLTELMIPQFIELIDRYDVDGFWVDGDIWAIQPCYCDRCKAAWRAATGIAEPPVKEDDADWPRWWNFTRESYGEFVTRYCDAVHAHKPGVLVCANWMQTFRNPGEPTAPTDWISGDNPWVFGMDISRAEARFLSTRNKPWDIMLWDFYCSHGQEQPHSPWTIKPQQMLMQEAAVLLAFGGKVQLYDNPLVRDGRLIPWRMRRLAEVGAFIKARQELCQHSETVPQIALLHSEVHLYSDVRSRSIIWSVDVAPAQGALFSLLENGYGVDILDEWALLPRLNDFPMIVVAEQTRMSEDMVTALKAYVEAGGKLLVAGCWVFDRFGEEFLGFRSDEVQLAKTYDVASDDGEVPIHSDWRLGEPVGGAESLGTIWRRCMLDDHRLPYSAAVINTVGKGQVIYAPHNVFRDFNMNRYPLARRFVGALVERLMPNPDIRVKAPTCIDVTLRRRGSSTMIHFVNRISGIPNSAQNGAIDEIPRIGPITVRMRTADRPSSVALALDDGDVKWDWSDGWLTAHIGTVHIHTALVVDA